MVTRGHRAPSPRHSHRRKPLSSRRHVLRRILGFGLALPFLGGLVAMVRRVQATNVPVDVVVPADVPVGLSVVESVIVHRDANGLVRAYSARCTHLGCLIDRVVADEAVCPCHGSRYRPDGTVAAGPASRSLRPLRVEPDSATGGWVARAS
jgi:Rieske Fe-S protein